MRESVPLQRGLQYVVKESFDTFLMGERLTFLERDAVYWDRGMVDYYNYLFYNWQDDKIKAWCVRTEDEAKRKYNDRFVLAGGWKRPGPKDIHPVNLGDFDISKNKKVLRAFIPYFKSILEGKDDIENWYYWSARHEALIEKVLLSRMEFLRFRTAPYNWMENLLQEFEVDYVKSRRYFWLSSPGANVS